MKSFTNDYPIIKVNGNHIEVIIHPYGKSINKVNTEFILDLNQFGDVIGIETLNLQLEVGEFCLNSIKKYINTTGDNVRHSYDAECDAFYLKLSNEASVDQKAIEGLLLLDEEGEIVVIKAELE